MEQTIRPMEPGDWPRVAEIYRQGIATGAATFERTCPTWAQWDGAHLPCCRLVCLAGGTVAAWAALSPTSGRAAYRGVAEVSLYVGREYRGLGLGKRLLAALCQASEQAGFWTLQSVIFQQNAASIRMNEACGFRLVGYREKIARDSRGLWQNTVLMERRSPLFQ